MLLAGLLVAAVVADGAGAHGGWDRTPTIAKTPEGPKLRVGHDPAEDPLAIAAGPTPEAPPPVELPAVAEAPADGGAAPGAPATLDPEVYAEAVRAYKLAPFRGLSTWVDLYDVDLTPTQQVEVAAAGGVDTVFVQTARFNSDHDIHDHLRLSELIEAAHDRGMRVMVWYIPDFVDLQRDLRRAQAAMAMVTPRGDRPDAFGLDIEVDDHVDVPDRTARLLQLSAALREWVGPEYPMAAIVLPPLQLELNTTWWPDFPYAELAAHYDVFVPMSYSSFRGTDADTTYGWNLTNVLRLRELTGVPDLPVHLAGGIADNLPEVDAFVAAARDAGAIGAGLYDLHTTAPSAWEALAPLSLPEGG